MREARGPLLVSEFERSSVHSVQEVITGGHFVGVLDCENSSPRSTTTLSVQSNDGIESPINAALLKSVSSQCKAIVFVQ